MDKGSYIHLKVVFMWECPLCSSENIHKGVEVSEEDVRLSLGLQEFEQLPEEFSDTMIVQPDSVTCNSCGLSFEIFKE